jgi:hypothetical protein
VTMPCIQRTAIRTLLWRHQMTTGVLLAQCWRLDWNNSSLTKNKGSYEPSTTSYTVNQTQKTQLSRSENENWGVSSRPGNISGELSTQRTISLETIILGQLWQPQARTWWGHVSSLARILLELLTGTLSLRLLPQSSFSTA